MQRIRHTPIPNSTLLHTLPRPAVIANRVRRHSEHSRLQHGQIAGGLLPPEQLGQHREVDDQVRPAFDRVGQDEHEHGRRVGLGDRGEGERADNGVEVAEGDGRAGIGNEERAAGAGWGDGADGGVESGFEEEVGDGDVAGGDPVPV